MNMELCRIIEITDSTRNISVALVNVKDMVKKHGKQQK